MVKQTAFDTVGEKFIDEYYETVRGKVREEVTRNNLLPFLPTPPALVADIGGGDGRDSAWLADQGYDVTLVDESVFMLKESDRWGPAFKRDNGNQKTLLEKGLGGKFDLVMSHCVLMYDLDDPVGHLRSLVDHLKAGGVLSFLTKSYGGVERRYQQQGDVAQLADLEATHQFQQSKDGLGQRVWAFDQTQITTMLENAGLTVLDWAGVRVATDDDRRLWRSISGIELRNTIRREIELAHDPAEKPYAQMLHFIAKKL